VQFFSLCGGLPVLAKVDFSRSANASVNEHVNHA
jgi:hypothetical protein